MTDEEIKIFEPIPLDHGFKVGDPVVDLTPEENCWPDVRGTVEKIDGTNIKVRYTTGNAHWKAYTNLRKDKP